MTPLQIIASLNSLSVGEVELIGAKLDEARRACLALQQTQLAEHLDEASQALKRADVRTYRKRVETVIAQLGHIK
jgi:hypothetical protein